MDKHKNKITDNNYGLYIYKMYKIYKSSMTDQALSGRVRYSSVAQILSKTQLAATGHRHQL